VSDELFIFLLGAFLLAWFAWSVIVPIILLVQVRRLRSELRARTERLERVVGEAGAVPADQPQSIEPAIPAAQAVPAGAPCRRIRLPALRLPADVNWELLIGQRGLGWLAVIVLLFAVAFFLRYAFENQWIGPLGRVSTGIAGGLGLVALGWHYFGRRWRVLSQMATAAGLVLLYLATFASFGFYRLVPQHVAAAFMFVLTVQGAGLAVRYDAPAIALMTVVGGLLTPLLMVSEHDQYIALFSYLGLLNTGVVLLAVWRHWRAIGLAALVGTQLLYWSWYVANHHPEKLLAALAFQGAIFALYLAHSLTTQWMPARRVGWPELVLFLVNPFSYFAAVYVLLRPDYGLWLGSVAVVLAAAYVVFCRLLLVEDRGGNGLALAALAVVLGFVALAFPIQADAAWVAMGWAAEAAALWWFGCRIEVGVLRRLGSLMLLLAVGRLVIMDTPGGTRSMFVPIFNEYGLPAAVVAGCVIGSVLATRRFVARFGRFDSVSASLTALVGVLLTWFILSVETRGFFLALARGGRDAEFWRWTGQVAMSVLWATYASLLLGIGLRWQQAGLRWLALGLFAVTAGKVFLSDMARLQAFYRILAFLVLAVLLAVAARAYQRLATKAAGGPIEGVKS
jgi:uncharacterized membrane protein